MFHRENSHDIPGLAPSPRYLSIFALSRWRSLETSPMREPRFVTMSHGAARLQGCGEEKILKEILE